jgi:predicted RNase H-like HicB family nuclease
MKRLDSDAMPAIWRGPAGERDWCAMSETYTAVTYTAVYERDGEAWFVEIAEEPRVHCQGSNLAEVRGSIRDALARWLKTDPGELRIVDNFRLPAQIRTARETVKATRTEDQRNQMMASMTDSKSAKSWAKELGIAERDPVTVQWLEELGDREVSIDTFCHTITMMEELSRLSANETEISPREVSGKN